MWDQQTLQDLYNSASEEMQLGLKCPHRLMLSLGPCEEVSTAQGLVALCDLMGWLCSGSVTVADLNSTPKLRDSEGTGLQGSIARAVSTPSAVHGHTYEHLTSTKQTLHCRNVKHSCRGFYLEQHYVSSMALSVDFTFVGDSTHAGTVSV